MLQDSAATKNESVRIDSGSGKLQGIKRHLHELLSASWMKRPEFRQVQTTLKDLSVWASMLEDPSAKVDSNNTGEGSYKDVSVQIEELGQGVSRIQRQLSVASKLNDCALPLSAEYLRLIDQPFNSFSPISFCNLREIARQIGSTANGDWVYAEFHPGLGTQILQAKLPGEGVAESLMTAILSAERVARVVHKMTMTAQLSEMVIAATLLQNCGMTVVHRAIPPMENPAQIQRHMRQHPVVGAAVVGSYGDAPTGIASLVAQHHERLTGTGYPRKLKGLDITPFSRIIGAAVRWEELRQKTLRDADFAIDMAELETQALMELLVETQAGDWEVSVVNRLTAHCDQAYLENLQHIIQEHQSLARANRSFEAYPDDFEARLDSAHTVEQITEVHFPVPGSSAQTQADKWQTLARTKHS